MKILAEKYLEKLANLPDLSASLRSSPLLSGRLAVEPNQLKNRLIRAGAATAGGIRGGLLGGGLGAGIGYIGTGQKNDETNESFHRRRINNLLRGLGVGGGLGALGGGATGYGLGTLATLAKN